MKIILMAIFYIVLTAIFIYLAIKEKTLTEKAREKQERFIDKILLDLKITNNKSIKNIKKIFNMITSIVVAIFLVIVIQRFYIGNFNIPTGSMIPTIEIKDRVFANMVKYKFIDPQREEIIVFKEPIQNKNLYTKRVMGLPGEKIEIKDDKLYIYGNEITSRRYSNLGIENKIFIVPKIGDKLKIVPAGDYKSVYKDYNIDIAEVQKALKENAAQIENAMPNLKFYINDVETGPILDFIHNDKILNELLAGKTVELTLDKNYFFALGDNTDGSYDSRFWGFVSKDRIRGEVLVRFWPLNRIGLVK